jgi:ketosteroid isomerase-like protein
MEPQTVDRAAHNIELVAAGYAAFGRGDLVAVEATFHPEVVWHVQRLGVLGGDHRGWPAVLTFFGRSMELTQGTFRVDVEEILANDTGAAIVVRSMGRRGDRVLDDRQVHLFHIEDDKVVEVWQFVGDGQATEAFWS